MFLNCTKAALHRCFKWPKGLLKAVEIGAVYIKYLWKIVKTGDLKLLLSSVYHAIVLNFREK
jgi:hypothetical protein